MRVSILALSVLGILVSADAAKAGPSTATRELWASVDSATFTDEATLETEDQIGLDKAKRRDVQRGLTGLGFDTRVNGKFDVPTRAVITRWQGARGYPKTGFLNTRYGPKSSRRRTPAPAAATNPMTTIRPVVAAEVVLTITAVVAVQVA
jgi:Putative peptidoglycan binding domain